MPFKNFGKLFPLNFFFPILGILLLGYFVILIFSNPCTTGKKKKKILVLHFVLNLFGLN